MTVAGFCQIKWLYQMPQLQLLGSSESVYYSWTPHKLIRGYSVVWIINAGYLSGAPHTLKFGTRPFLVWELGAGPKPTHVWELQNVLGPLGIPLKLDNQCWAELYHSFFFLNTHWEKCVYIFWGILSPNSLSFSLYKCVCVCVRERERKRERDW